MVPSGGHRSTPRVLAALAGAVHDRQGTAGHKHNGERNQQQNLHWDLAKRVLQHLLGDYTLVAQNEPALDAVVGGSGVLSRQFRLDPRSRVWPSDLFGLRLNIFSVRRAGHLVSPRNCGGQGSMEPTKTFYYFRTAQNNRSGTEKARCSAAPILRSWRLVAGALGFFTFT
jgi:hypothetical protein